MRKIILLAGLALAGCTSAQQQTAKSVGCEVDTIAVPLATTGAGVAAAVDPTIAPEVGLATALDKPVHAQVQADLCGPAAPPK